MTISINRLHLIQRLITQAFWTARNAATRGAIQGALRELLPMAAGKIPVPASRLAWLSAAYGGDEALADALQVGANVVHGWQRGKAPDGAAAKRLDALSAVYGLPKDTLRPVPGKPRPGRPFVSQEDPISQLAKAVGGWAALAILLGDLHSDTPRSWAPPKNKVPRKAMRDQVDALCAVNGIQKPDWQNLE